MIETTETTGQPETEPTAVIVCAGCGAQLGFGPRHTSPNGEYYCMACWEPETAREHEEGGGAAQEITPCD